MYVKAARRLCHRTDAAARGNARAARGVGEEMAFRLALTLAAALLAAVACVSTTPDRPSPAPPRAASDRCEADRDVVAALGRFFDAFNTGDTAGLSALLSSEFQGYSAMLPDGLFVAWTRAEVADHQRARFARGDRFEFGGAQVNGPREWDGAAHFGPLNLVVISGGERYPLTGKGALYCAGSLRGLKVLGLAPAAASPSTAPR
jgi:hypothetical protein